MRELATHEEVVNRALSASRADGCVVIVSDSSEVEMRFACNTTTTNGMRRDRHVTVVSLRRVGEGWATGVASRSGAVDLEDLVRASEADAREAGPAVDAAPLLAPEGEGDDLAAQVPETSASLLGGVLGDLGEAFHRARMGGRVLSGFAEHSLDTVSIGTSTGLRRRHTQPTGRLQLVARNQEGTASAWAGVASADWSDVSLFDLDAKLETRLGWATRRVDLPAGRYEVIMPPDSVADLVCMVGDALGARAAQDGRSVFSAPGGGTREGEQLWSVPFELRSDPAEAGLECADFLVTAASGPDSSVFDNGMQLQRTVWVQAGRLVRLRRHRAAAAAAGVPAAAEIDNLVLEAPGSLASVSDMVERTRRGLLLTCLWYIREVDPQTLLLTGLTRDGVYLVENGEVVGAVNNFRFNESPVDLLGRVSEVGMTQRCLSREWNEWFPRTAMPALRVPDFNMSSVSPAT